MGAFTHEALSGTEDWNAYQLSLARLIQAHLPVQ
jgi:hypothetical protein